MLIISPLLIRDGDLRVLKMHKVKWWIQKKFLLLVNVIFLIFPTQVKKIIKDIQHNIS